MQVKVYNQEGKETGRALELPAGIFAAEKIKPELVHLVAVASLANARKSVASSKTRGEVRGGGKKPWQQKGTGRARAGSIRSPLWKGGGITFGPRPNRNFAKKVNRKTRRAGLLSVLSDRARENRMLVLENLAAPSGKTREIAGLLKNLSAFTKGRKALLIIPDKNLPVLRAARNLPNLQVALAGNLNILELLSADTIIFLKDSLPVIEKTYGNI